MALPDKCIIFLGRTFSGHQHDYLMLQHELPPALDWFADINVRVDLGDLGMQTDDTGDRIDIPTKKPRKSKKNPTPQLSDEHKAANTALSQVRIFIEHVIGGMKRSNILVHVFRNRQADFEDAAPAFRPLTHHENRSTLLALRYRGPCLETGMTSA